MKEDLKSMNHNEVRDLVELPKGCKRVGVNESLRLRVTEMAISNIIRPNPLPIILLRMMMLTSKRPFHMSLKRTLIMAMLGHYDLELH